MIISTLNTRNTHHIYLMSLETELRVPGRDSWYWWVVGVGGCRWCIYSEGYLSYLNQHLQAKKQKTKVRIREAWLKFFWASTKTFLQPHSRVQRKREEREQQGSGTPALCTSCIWYWHLGTSQREKSPLGAFEIHNYSTALVISSRTIVLWKNGVNTVLWIN